MTLDGDCLEAVSTAQAERWRTHLPARKSVFGSVEFASIAERHRGESAWLVLFRRRDENVPIVYPLFLRPVSELPFGDCVPPETWDAASPEYTGPLALEPIAEATGQAFRRLFDGYCQGRQIVTEFAHLNPWRSYSGTCRRRNVHFDREIVYVDLVQSEGDLWRKSLTRACRKNINRARAEGVRVFPAETLEQIRQFHQIYIHTMERNHAQAKYYYPLEFFVDFFEQMPGNARFALAEHDGKIVAGTLFLHDEQEVYSYLGGAYDAHQSVRPTNAVVYDTIRWAREQSKKRLILGGGYKHGDGIFRFKASFSPLRVGFSVYRQIHMPGQYDTLCSEWAARHRASPEHGGFFPQYRSQSENLR